MCVAPFSTQQKLCNKYTAQTTENVLTHTHTRTKSCQFNKTIVTRCNDFQATMTVKRKKKPTKVSQKDESDIQETHPPTIEEVDRVMTRKNWTKN